MPKGHAAHPGQTIVIFALASLVLLAGTGLVLDSGYNFVQRRTMQNAADAAAFAGTQLLTRNAQTTEIAATVVAVAVQNGVPSSANVNCQYITDLNTSGAAPCQTNTKPPTNLGTITGVRVTVSETHGTFIMRAVGIATSGTSATAAAQAQIASGFTGGPFIPCGFNTELVGGGQQSILVTYDKEIGKDNKGKPIYEKAVYNDANGFALIDWAVAAYDWNGYLPTTPANQRGPLPKPGPGIAPAAGKPHFLIHGPQINDCDAESEKFKGLNNTTTTIELPAVAGAVTVVGDNGVKAGPTRMRRVPGVFGCDAEPFDGCVMILPIVDNSNTKKDGANISFAARQWGAFWITDVSNGNGNNKVNKHGAYLIANYPLTATGQVGWTPAYNGVETVALIR